LSFWWGYNDKRCGLSLPASSEAIQIPLEAPWSFSSFSPRNTHCHPLQSSLVQSLNPVDSTKKEQEQGSRDRADVVVHDLWPGHSLDPDDWRPTRLSPSAPKILGIPLTPPLAWRDVCSVAMCGRGTRCEPVYEISCRPRFSHGVVF